jgi:hypothetical protein
MTCFSRRIVLLWCATILASWPVAASADSALDWIATVDQATAKVPGIRGDRARAIAWLAAFNALDAIEPRFRPYPPAPAPLTTDAPRPSPDVAFAAAIYTALVGEPDAEHALLVRRYRESLSAVKSTSEREAGAILGQQAALMLLAARSNDRLERVEAPARAAAAGVFVVPPDVKTSRSIHGGRLAPFAIRSLAEFDPGPPPTVGSDASAREIAEVRSLGGVVTNVARNADQTAAALFWVSNEPSDFSALFLRGLEARKLANLDVARIAALDAMITFDSAVVGTTFKERYLHWRPESAIAGAFAPARDAAWQPLVPAPPSPEYPSTGAISAGILAVELPRLFGLDGAIELKNGQTQQTRRWPSAAALAEEFAESRIWAGAHFRSAIDAGQRVGRRLASDVLDRQLQPR